MSGPWFITPQAVRDYLRIRGWVDDELNFQRGLEDLIDIAKEMAASGKQGKLTSRCYLSYRTGRKYGRMVLVVSPVPDYEGDLPQLVAVTRSRN
jgi:hypothetical protein